MSWCVVSFVEENTVECVPHSWYVKESKECFWPPERTPRHKIQDFIKHRERPTESWQPYKVNLLGYYDDLKKKAEYFDELSSHGENLPEKRRIKRNIRYKSTSESSYASFENDLEFPKFPSQKRGIPLGRDGQEGPQNEKNKYLLVDADHKSSGTKEYNEDIDTVTSDLSNKSESYQNASIIKLQSGEASACSTPRIHTTLHTVPDSTPKNTITVNDSLSSMFASTIERTPVNPPDRDREDFQRKVLSELAIVNTKVDMVLESLQIVMKRSQIQESNNYIKNKDELIAILNIFPLEDTDGLRTLEDWLKTDVVNIHTLANELSRIGGSSVKDLVRRIMFKIFHNNLGMQYTWEGAHKKLKFKELVVAKVILESARTSFPNATELEVIGYIKLWLVRCKDREQRKKD